MDRQNGKKGYHAMKEQKSDDLERMFREGLRDLKAEPDAAVWLAIQDAMKKRRRFWLFWSITGMVAIGLVATVLLQSDTQLASEERTFGRSGEREVSKPQASHPDRVRRSFSAKEQQANGTSVDEEPSRRVEGPKPQERHPEQADEISGEEEPSRRVEGPKPITQNPAPNTLMSLRIPFLYQEQLRDYPLLVSGYKPKPKADSTNKMSPWSLAFNPGLLLPSVQSFGKTGTVNYEKTNEFRPGVSISLYLNHAFKQNWIMRSGINWSSYSVSGNHRYFGYTDTVEWIDRDRNTGFQTVQKDRYWDFESRYQWIGIPIELGRRQNFNNGFGWEWTIGGGLNYLYSYDKIAGGNKYLSGIDESIKRLQFNISAGFGAHYQWKGPWSTFVNVRYRLQPNYLYESEMLREKHQILQFGIGLQYQFKWKGN